MNSFSWQQNPTIRDIGSECHAGRADRTATRQTLAAAVIDKFDMFDQAANLPDA
jgi:hypothetical protein